MSPYLLALEAGHRGSRCLLLNVETGQTLTVRRTWPSRSVTGGDLELASLWQTLGEVTQAALTRAGIEPAQVCGLAATGIRQGWVLLDAQGQALAAYAPPAEAWGTEALTPPLEAESAPLEQPGGYRLAVYLRWLAQRAPALWQKTQTILTLSDWLGFRLTGVAVAERSQAAESQLLDLTTGAWAADRLADLHLPPTLFPPVREAGTQLGPLTAAAADHLGLPAGLPVAVGGEKTRSGLLGAGAYGSGALVATLGSAAFIQMVTDQPPPLIDSRLESAPHLVPGVWVLTSHAGPLGQRLERWAQLLYPDSPLPVAALGAEATNVPPGAPALFFPGGGPGCFPGGERRQAAETLTLAPGRDREQPTRPMIARALWEGLAYTLKAALQPLLETTGIPLTTLTVGGGLTRSAGLVQLVSDVLEVPLVVAATPETAALGAALCAGVAAGLYPTLEAATQALAGSGRQQLPDPEAAPVYREGYAGWSAQRLAADLKPARRPEVTPASSAAALAPAPPGFRPRFYVTAALDAASVMALREVADIDHVSYRDELRLLSGDDLVEALQGYHGFITELDVVTADLLPRLPDLRVIGVCRGAPVNVDIAACTAFGIPVLNTPGRNADAVADLAVAFMLTLLRRLPAAQAFLREPGSEAGDLGRLGLAYTRFQGRELWQKTVGLIGFGAVGRQVARRLRPFGARVLVYDPYLTDEQAALGGAERVALETLLAESDLISLHAPVTDKTRGLLNAAAFARMKRGALLINTARAALVDETALLAALRSGQLGGAGLDVFAVEPPGADHPLLALPNVIATPHLGGDTVEVAAHQGQMIAEDVRRLLRGERPSYLRNPEVLAHFSWTAPRPTPAAETLARLTARTGPAVTDLEVQAAAERQTAAPAAPLPPPPPPGNAPPPTTSVSKTWRLLAGVRRLLFRKSAAISPAGPPPGEAARAQMARLLQDFTARLRVHEGLREFSQGKQILILFILTDLELSFYVNCQDGAVEAAPGTPPTPPDVTLKLRAALLDGLFTGRVNAVQAAMSGQLSFSGDTAKAMALQRLQKMVGPLYLAARAATGSPEDWTAVTPAASAPARPQPVSNEALRAELVTILQELYAHGLITATGGNLSVRTAGQPAELWITPSQSFKGALEPAMLVRLNLEGRPLEPHSLPPSSEWRVHTAIYRRRPDVQAIIHTHAPRTLTLGLTGKPFLPITPAAASVGELERVPFHLPGTAELAEAVAQALGAGHAVLMEQHGLVVAGSTLRHAANVTEIIEETAAQLLTCYELGQTPPVLPAEVVAQLRASEQLKG